MQVRYVCTDTLFKGQLVRITSKKTKSVFILVGMLLAAVTICGCEASKRVYDTSASDNPSSDNPSPGNFSHNNPLHEKPIRIVATYSILGDWVRKIGGDQVKLATLVGPGGDAHTYEPTPRDSVALSKADIVFENGLGFETWLDRLFEASGSKARRIVVTAGIKPRELVQDGKRTEVDPHVWHLPSNAVRMVEAITDALVQAQPAYANEFRQRQSEYVGQLHELDEWISQETSSIPEQRRKLVTTHDTFGYMADAYGYEVLSVLGSGSSEVSDPSAAQVAAIIDRIRKLKIPAIFSENILNPQLTRQIADQAGVKIVPTLYTDALGPAESTGSDYLSMMRFNIRTIVEALR